jgi:hypothetical protein
MKDIIQNTVFGPAVLTKKCTCCKQTLNVTEYYTRINSKGEKVARARCVPCFSDDTKKRSKKKKYHTKEYKEKRAVQLEIQKVSMQLAALKNDLRILKNTTVSLEDFMI